jgi:hypothetical protein
MDCHCHDHLFALELGAWNCERDDRPKLPIFLWPGMLLVLLCGRTTLHHYFSW